MIIVELLGGLGNQLFQYAAGMALARRLGVPLKLDISAFDRYQLRRYELCKFRISAPIATPDEVRRLAPTGNRISRALWRLRHGASRAYCEEKGFVYDPKFLELQDPSYLRGYWQVPRYFEPIADQLRSEFQLKTSPEGRNRELISAMRGCSSVAVHVRRGDYVSNPEAAKFHGICGLEYYETAAERMVSVVNDARFFVFSDEPDWCKVHLRLPGPVTYVNNNSPDNGEEDLRLMSSCRNHIIANSSFSWWGAWLGRSPIQKVFAPARWVLAESQQASDILPDGWEKVGH